MKTYKQLIISVIGGVIIILGSISLANCIIDPLWCFSHVNQLNNYQIGFNERQQKTNRITFQEFNYDTLIIGSSRTTYINQNDFMGLHAYNYAADSMRPEEFNDYIEYAKKKNGKDFKYIIIGLDFFGTNPNRVMKSEPPNIYISRANEFLYQYKTLLSKDTLFNSLNIIKKQLLHKPGTFEDYNRSNVKQPKHANSKEKEKRIHDNIKLYSEVVYGNYKYNANYKNILIKIKKANPNTKFIIFTTPESIELYKVMIKKQRFEDFKRWQYEIIDVFGEYYSFMGSNSISNNLDNYFDAHHFYPEIGTLIAHKILNIPDKNMPNDFGILITKENLEKHLLSLENQIKTINK